MKIITEYEDIMARLQSYGKPYWTVKEEECNCTMFTAYFHSKKDGKELLDFNDIIWDKDIKAIAEAVRRFGIREFTISVQASAIIDILTAFQDLGIRVESMTKVQTNQRDAYMNEAGDWIEGYKVINAFLMKVE